MARYNTGFPARRGTEVAVTGSTRNRLGGASRHVGSNPTPSATLPYTFGCGSGSNPPNHDNPDGHGRPSAEAATDGHGF